MTTNPYAPPGDHQPVTALRPAAGAIAGPRQRLWSAAIDWGALIVVTSIVGSLIDSERFDVANALVWAVPAPHTITRQLAWKGAAVALLVQALLIGRSGQSLGKLVAGLQIVRRDGRKVGIFQGFVLRELPFRAFTFLAGFFASLDHPFSGQIGLLGLCMLVNLLDDAWILGAERRCLHDRLAGTWVVTVR